MNGSVRPSVCLSVTPFSLCSLHRIIMKFSGVITNDKSDVHAKGQGQRSKAKVTLTEVKSPFSRFRTVTTVWIHIWRWNHTYSLVLLRRDALLLYPPYPKDRGMLWFYVEAARHPPPAARNGVNAITQKPLDGLFSNLVYTLVVIVSWPD